MRGMSMGIVGHSSTFNVQSSRSEVRGPRSQGGVLPIRNPQSAIRNLRGSLPIRNPQSAIRNPKGFTLLEVLVALAVLAVALVGLLGLHNRNLLLTARAERLSTATLLAREMLTRTQLEGPESAKMTSGDFSDLHPGRYPEFRWHRTVRPAPIDGLWELRVNVSWGEREDERCELTLFTPLS